MSSSASRPPVLLLIGWDGATPELLQRFVAAGDLPTVAGLMQRGSFRHLRSTIPPVTACAWSSFLGGKNPGRHGLFDFVRPRKDRYAFDYTNGGYRRDRGSDFPALLNRNGVRVGLINVPMTYPPDELDGFVVSGLDAPDEKSGIASPADLFERVQQQVGAYRIDNRHLGHMKTEAERRQVLDEFKRIETRRTDVGLAMMAEQPVDVLVLVYNATDQVQHHFWHLMDASHPQHPGSDSREVEVFGGAIREIYVHCDRELARLIEAYPEANVMLLSDHGAGPTSGPRVRLNNALAQAGLLRWSSSSGSSRLVARLDGLLRRSLNTRQKAMLNRLLPAGRAMIESRGLPPIDWSRTSAFVYEGFTLAPCVWIHRKNLFPSGTVDDGKEYDRTVEKVIECLTALTDPATGEQVIPAVYRSSELYHGPETAMAPDLILDWWNDRTFTMIRSEPHAQNAPVVVTPEPTAVPGKDITGIHRRDGVLVASGPQLASLPGARRPAADLMDIAPTVLTLLGLDGAADMDGTSIDELVEARLPREETASGGDKKSSSEIVDGDSVYSDEDRRIIENRLKDLGYME